MFVVVWLCWICSIDMVDFKVMILGLFLKLMGIGVGGGILICLVCWVWVKVGWLLFGRVVVGSGGVIGEIGGCVGDGGFF